MKKVLIIASILVMSLTLSACGTDSEQAINAYTRDTSSGTREAFMKGIGFGDAAEDDSVLVDGKTEVSGNSDMIAKVKVDENGIGYISLSSLEGSSLIGLTFEGIEATVANVLNDTYGLKRPFMYMTRTTGDYSSDETEDIVQALVAYMDTMEGQAIIEAKGGIVNSEDSSSWDTIKDNYTICTEENSDIAITIGGSTSVEKIAKELTADFSGKCGNFTATHNHEGSSAAYKGVQKTETKDTASYLDLGFSSRNFKTEEVGAEGTYGRICWDAVVAVVNESNNYITNTTAEELKQIYSGEVTTWAGIK